VVPISGRVDLQRWRDGRRWAGLLQNAFLKSLAARLRADTESNVKLPAATQGSVDSSPVRSRDTIAVTDRRGSIREGGEGATEPWVAAGSHVSNSVSARS